MEIWDWERVCTSMRLRMRCWEAKIEIVEVELLERAGNRPDALVTARVL